MAMPGGAEGLIGAVDAVIWPSKQAHFRSTPGSPSARGRVSRTPASTRNEVPRHHAPTTLSVKVTPNRAAGARFDLDVGKLAWRGLTFEAGMMGHALAMVSR